MNSKSFFFILFCLVLITARNAASSSTNEGVLKQLDNLIRSKTVQHQNKEEQLAKLKQQLRRTSSADEKYKLCDLLFNEYLHYQADSALNYIEQKELLIPAGDPDQLKTETIINRAEVYGVMGRYNEALEKLEQVDPWQPDS